MLTLFTTAKPFTGHNAVIQRNALQSWKLLHPDVEVILFGDEEGAAEVCAELGLRHEPNVERNPAGLPYVSSMFLTAQKIARHDLLCYSNCDIVYTQDFSQALQKAFDWSAGRKFLMIGQRWDADITAPIDFSYPAWASAARDLAREKGFRQFPEFVDYFAFRRGLYDEIPPLVIGWFMWDWWLVGKALRAGVPVIDATPHVTAIHQNHGTHSKAKQALRAHNIAIAGGKENLRFTIDATHKIDRSGEIRPRTFGRHLRRVYFLVTPARWIYGHSKRFLVYNVWLPAWHFCLNLTRPLRTRLGMRPRPAERGKKNAFQPGVQP